MVYNPIYPTFSNNNNEGIRAVSALDFEHATGLAVYSSIINQLVSLKNLLLLFLYTLHSGNDGDLEDQSPSGGYEQRLETDEHFKPILTISTFEWDS